MQKSCRRGREREEDCPAGEKRMTTKMGRGGEWPRALFRKRGDNLKAVADDKKLDVWSNTMEQLLAHHTN